MAVDKAKRREDLTGLEARAAAQRIAHGPIVFQAARLLRDMGVLEALAADEKGADVAEVQRQTGVSPYGVTVLLEAGLGMGAVRQDGERYRLTKVGRCLLDDEMTRVNMDFVQHCCVEPVNHLEASIREGRPAGLHEVFGERGTIYAALPRFPEPARGSWFRWDHYYSDAAFPAALRILAARGARRLLDVGGNTGKWSVAFVRGIEDARATIVDLPEMLELAGQRVETEGLGERIELRPMDLLDHDAPLPRGFDALWMSQLLVCFPEEDVLRLLRRAAAALDGDAALYILDTFWDRQRFAAASSCLQASSLYFTFLANGQGRMYRFETIRRFVEAAGMRVEHVEDDLGICSSLLVCRRTTP